MLLAVLGAVLVVMAFALDARLKVAAYEVSSSKIESAVRIVFVSDLHSCLYGPGQEKLLEAVAAQEPDLVLLGGDIVDDVLPRGNAELFLAGISAAYPCYFVTGNHEIWDEDTDGILAMIQGYGVPILRGDWEMVEIRGQAFNLCGVDDPAITITDGALVGTREQLAALAGLGGGGNGFDPRLFTILLSHRPELVSEYGKYDFDLVLAGHAHGGQIRIPGIMNGLLAPDQGIFPKYAGGFYAFKGEGGSGNGQKDWQMIVSRGLAKESTIVPRVFNRPELVVVELVPGE